jgi:hypothetical protein
VKSINKIWTMGKVSSGFPAIVASIVALPLNKILVLVTVFAVVQYVLNFVFDFVVDLDWW